MKHGILIDGNIQIYGEVIDGKWEGLINYNENHERLTATEMIAKYNLKEIVLKSGFVGNEQDYNFVEQNGKLVQADMKAEVKTEYEKAIINAEITRFENLLREEDYKPSRYTLAKELGNDLPYTHEYMVDLEIKRQGYRDKIRELRLKL